MNEYGRVDYSYLSDIRVRGRRTISPRGTLIHSSSGADSTEWLTTGSANAGSPASANALIQRDGRQLLLCPDGWYPYHAGKSVCTLDRVYRDDEVSQVLIGIELECLVGELPTYEQVDSLADLCLYFAGRWLWRWPLWYTGHYSVARPLGRRSDPVNFPWGDLAGRLFERANAIQLAGL